MARRQLSDDRSPMTVEQADALLRDLALAAASLAKRAAAADDAIARIKAKFDADAAADKAAVATAEARLTAYIEANRDRFAKVKTRKTIFGGYGLRSATRVKVTDALAAYRFACDRGIDDLCCVSYKVSNRAVAREVKAGRAVPGCEVVSGEVAGYKLNLDVAEQALDTDAPGGVR
ncbi:MAG: host-nuclease inhibitor Gam family protein [Victivallaceae bacterium]|nr:host-nuclease inhibitor Gam family protein [Victivallaceae bacterium]